MFTPRASRQSAVPHFEEAALLPCFDTFIPAAAATNAEVVDILKLCALSPPVPTISKVSMSPASTVSACSRIAAAHPAISSIVSDFVLLVDNAARKAAFCVGVVSPLIISFITLYASSYVRSCLSTILTIASLIIFSTLLKYV